MVWTSLESRLEIELAQKSREIHSGIGMESKLTVLRKAILTGRKLEMR